MADKDPTLYATEVTIFDCMVWVYSQLCLVRHKLLIYCNNSLAGQFHSTDTQTSIAANFLILYALVTGLFTRERP